MIVVSKGLEFWVQTWRSENSYWGELWRDPSCTEFTAVKRQNRLNSDTCHNNLDDDNYDMKKPKCFDINP